MTVERGAAIEDLESAHPVPSAWRQTFRDIVGAFARGDHGIANGLPGVARVSASDAEHIRSYIADYGETLTELPEESWETSVAQWMDGHWEVLVDLWTVEAGASDLVLSARVFEEGTGVRIEVHMVYVP